MFLELYIIFLALCFVMIFVGYYTEIHVVALIGFTGILLLGLLLTSGAVSELTGKTETNTPATFNNTVYINSTTIINNYTAITDTTSKWLGRWLAFAGALGFILVIVSNKNTSARK